MSTLDLSSQKVIASRDVEAAGKAGATKLIIRADGILTPSARDLMSKLGMRAQHAEACPRASGNNNGTNNVDLAVTAYGMPATSAAKPDIKAVNVEMERLFQSPEAKAIKEEICAVGHKLWRRSYVDGNGGNISYRISENAVICTPTLLSKADLTPDDLCMVDLAGNQLAGKRPRTSEIFLHLEIYKNVPEAKGAVHCHPPHATAYAITGHIPPSGVVPEFDVFVGTVAVTPYETPGTQKFAETVLPYVRSHNTILLGNHGIVCWADTVTHAEWYAEVLETYCWTLTISRQLGVPYSRIPTTKEQDLLSIKKRLGLPDARFDMQECVLSDLPEHPGAIAFMPPISCGRPGASTDATADAEIEAIVQAATDAVMSALREGQNPQ
jgi:L-fuculose-phosphate aldolase